MRLIAVLLLLKNGFSFRPSFCGIYGGQRGFLRVRRFPYLYHSTSALYSHFSNVLLTLGNLSN